MKIDKKELPPYQNEVNKDGFITFPVTPEAKPMNIDKKMEEKFNRKFCPNELDGERVPEYEMTSNLLKLLKAFISQALSDQRQELIEWAEKKKKTKEAKREKEKVTVARDNWFYNKALDDIIDHLK